MPRGIPKSGKKRVRKAVKRVEVPKKLQEAIEKERDARRWVLHWSGRCHPNSEKMLGLKNAHYNVMMELNELREELGMSGLGVKSVSVSDPFEGEKRVGQVAYESGHRVQGLRSEKEENQRV